MDQENHQILPPSMITDSNKLPNQTKSTGFVTTDGNSLSPGSIEHADQEASLGFVTTNGNGQ